MSRVRSIASILYALAALGVVQPSMAAELVVSAASSLTNAFREIGTAFEKAHPGDKVVFNFAASDVLLSQIARGAPADVFAAADQEAMDKAAAQGLIDVPTRFDFARNRLVVVVPAGKSVPASLSQLIDPVFKQIALGNPTGVPVGRYAKAALEDAGLWLTLAPRFIPTQNVRQALDYVARSECDAGFVYATDATLMPDKVTIAFEVPTKTPVTYPIAVVRSTSLAPLAREFVAWVRAPAAQTVLARYGFGNL